MELPWWLPFGRVPEIAASELWEILGHLPSLLVLDVRTPAEFAGGHVPGAVNLPLTSLASRLGPPFLDPARRVVAVCLTGHRSVAAVRLLCRRSFQASQLAGGMMAWRAERLPEERMPRGTRL